MTPWVGSWWRSGFWGSVPPPSVALPTIINPITTGGQKDPQNLSHNPLRNTTCADPSLSRRTLEGMQTQRNVVSHALQRRHTLEALLSPQVDLNAPTACDADPMLVRAAMHHGEPLDHDCPVCESPRLVLLRHVFGHQLGQYSGRIRTVDELEEMEHQFGEFHVYEVEVCPDCLWNHILVDYVLGDGRRRRPPRHQPTVEDIYG